MPYSLPFRSTQEGWSCGVLVWLCCLSERDCGWIQVEYWTVSTFQGTSPCVWKSMCNFFGFICYIPHKKTPFTLHRILTGAQIYVGCMSECRNYFLKALVEFSMENVGVDDTEWEEKIISKGLMDICHFLPVSGCFGINRSHLYENLSGPHSQ